MTQRSEVEKFEAVLGEIEHTAHSATGFVPTDTGDGVGAVALASVKHLADEYRKLHRVYRPARGVRPASAAWFSYMAPALVHAARLCGYALAVHGSMTTDLDLIAVPWVDDARPAEVLIHALRDVVGGDVHGPEERACGRLAWTIHFTEDKNGAYVDVSVFGNSLPIL